MWENCYVMSIIVCKIGHVDEFEMNFVTKNQNYIQKRQNLMSYNLNKETTPSWIPRNVSNDSSQKHKMI